MLAVTGLSEASGIAASRTIAGVLFTHNDSGHPAEVYAVTEDGAHVATLAFTGALAHDWEDIAIGPGPVDGAHYLYVADIGDDPDEPWRETVIVERALEPELASTDRARGITLDFDSIYLSYPDGPHNAETLFVDPATSDLYIVTKASSRAAVYVARAPLSLDSVSHLELVTELSFVDDGVPSGLKPAAIRHRTVAGPGAYRDGRVSVATHPGRGLFGRLRRSALRRAACARNSG